MTAGSTKTLRPEFRPFVIRPTMFAAIPGGFLLAGSFFFWTFLGSLIGDFAWAVPGLGAAIIAFVLVERLVRYSKTRYRLTPDQVIVETGTIFRSRAVELDLANVTLVQWESPWLLRKFYGVGHVTAQEAGSAAQPARMAYIRNPGDVYSLIGEYMRAHGFRLERSRKVQQEEPGHIGATVDLTYSIVAMFWAVILVGFQIALEAMPLIIGEGPSLLQLVLGNYDVFADSTSIPVLAKARIGAVVLGIATVGLTGAGVLIAYLDLLHRRYILYDDVIDYIDGFLNETRKFIPLENLADTEVSRPVFKRVLGLSDVRLSSQGAENSIAFASTPNGPAFAEAIERLVNESKKEPRQVSSRSSSDVPEQQSAVETDDERRLVLEPEPIRAALRGFGTTTIVLSAFIGLAFDYLGESFEFNFLSAIGIWGAAVTGVLALGAAAALGAGWWIIKARRTSFVLDDRGVRRTFNLLSSNDTRFALERITSFSVFRNPIDRLLGTMTVRFRSIGSDEDLDFWGIDENSELMRMVRARFGIDDGSGADPVSFDAREGRLTPAFRLLDGLTAKGPFYGLLAIPFLTVALIAVILEPTYTVWIVLGMGAVPVAIIGPHMAVRALIHRLMQGEVLNTHVEVSGGIFVRYKHIAPLEHVKAVESVRYPGSSSGALTFRTAGFPIGAGHVPEVKQLHEHVDNKLSAPANEVGDAAPIAEYKPHVGTQMVRHSWMALTVIGLPVLLWLYAFYRRVEYRLERRRLLGDSGLYFDKRVTVLFDRVDHIESKKTLAHGLFDTYDVEVYTVGSPLTDLVFRSLERDTRALETIRRQLGKREGDR
jgi:uncharacterized membrane protein YdbT with pleckstrin-like domain